MRAFLFLVFGGASGTLLRFGLSQWFATIKPFPAGTFIANLFGCFVIGFLFQISEKQGLDRSLQLFWMSGFCGALTTFSTLILELHLFFRNGAYLQGIIYLLASLLLGLALFQIGFWIAAKI